METNKPKRIFYVNYKQKKNKNKKKKKSENFSVTVGLQRI